jgi:hypothetical protein
MANERGSALLVTLVVLVVLTVLGTSIVFVSQTDHRAVENERWSAQSLDLAEAGAREVKRWLDHPRSAEHCVLFPDVAVVDRTLRRIDVDGAGPAAAVLADGTPAKPRYKQGSDLLFDRPFTGDLADAFLGTADGPDVRIEDASFLADLSERLLPAFPGSGVTARIARIDAYGPPYRPVGGVFTAGGIATIAATARIYRDVDGAVLAESKVTVVLDEVPYSAAFGPLRTCGDLAWSGPAPARWGAVVASGTVTLPPDHTLVPASLARGVPADPRRDSLRFAAPAEDVLFLAYKEKVESQDGGLVVEDPWLRVVAGAGFVNAPPCVGGTADQPCPFLWDGASDLAGGQRPSHEAGDDGSHSNLFAFPMPCESLDYALWKRIAASGDRDVHLFTWEGGTTFRERGTGRVGDVRDLTDDRTGLFFFDTMDGTPPRDDNLTPGILISGGTWGARGLLFWNGASFGIEGVTGRAATAAAPGEPLEEGGTRYLNLAYPPALGDPFRGSAVDALGGGVVRNASGPAIATEASFWGLLHVSGSFTESGAGRIVGAVDAAGSITESEVWWDERIASGWPPEGWDLPRTFVRSWRTEP